MKKIIILICLLSLGFSATRIQWQSSLAGSGFGAGVGSKIIPGLLEVGVEGSLHDSPVIASKGSYNGTPYSGKYSMSMTRVGAYVGITIPIIDRIPVIGLFACPTLHAGTQSGIVDVNGDIRFVGDGNIFSGKKRVQGSYVLLGFPGRFGPFFIEPAVGSQHFFIPGVINQSVIDAQIAMGLWF